MRTKCVYMRKEKLTAKTKRTENKGKEKKRKMKSVKKGGEEK